MNRSEVVRLALSRGLSLVGSDLRRLQRERADNVTPQAGSGGALDSESDFIDQFAGLFASAGAPALRVIATCPSGRRPARPAVSTTHRSQRASGAVFTV